MPPEAKFILKPQGPTKPHRPSAGDSIENVRENVNENCAKYLAFVAGFASGGPKDHYRISCSGLVNEFH